MHPIDYVGIHLLHCMYYNVCIRTQDVVHDILLPLRKMLASSGMKTTICTSLNHVQFLMLMSEHCVDQRWNSHLS
jgi:hypothetical protein